MQLLLLASPIISSFFVHNQKIRQSKRAKMQQCFSTPATALFICVISIHTIYVSCAKTLAQRICDLNGVIVRPLNIGYQITQCPNSTNCIFDAWIENGSYDCQNLTDVVVGPKICDLAEQEILLGANFNFTIYRCPNIRSRCIPIDFVFDHINDCGDMSDENACIQIPVFCTANSTCNDPYKNGSDFYDCNCNPGYSGDGKVACALNQRSDTSLTSSLNTTASNTTDSTTRITTTTTVVVVITTTTSANPPATTTHSVATKPGASVVPTFVLALLILAIFHHTT